MSDENMVNKLGAFQAVDKILLHEVLEGYSEGRYVIATVTFRSSRLSTVQKTKKSGTTQMGR